MTPLFPLFCSITRLAYQKGPELILYGIEEVLKKGGSFILLGTTQDPKIEKQFQLLREKLKSNEKVYFHFHFNEKLAHLTFAAADFLFVPSYYEPCGLTQMIALLYGTIPIVHQVGGLKDTIFDIDDLQSISEKGNGYVFTSPAKEKVKQVIDRAFDHFVESPKMRQKIIYNGLTRDWSWKTPVKEYLHIYQHISSVL
ncbi:MAG: glycosyltransferase [Simkania negevensis]|nr:glycosyltransferase [Simkania negevensis]